MHTTWIFNAHNMDRKAHKRDLRAMLNGLLAIEEGHKILFRGASAKPSLGAKPQQFTHKKNTSPCTL